MVAEKAKDLSDAASAEAEKKAPLWNGAQEADCLSLYFAATAKLPKNSMRNLVVNADEHNPGHGHLIDIRRTLF